MKYGTARVVELVFAAVLVIGIVVGVVMLNKPGVSFRFFNKAAVACENLDEKNCTSTSGCSLENKEISCIGLKESECKLPCAKSFNYEIITCSGNPPCKDGCNVTDTVANCSDFNNDLGTCRIKPGCSITERSCTGPSGCSNDNCDITRGCGWKNPSCSGTYSTDQRCTGTFTYSKYKSCSGVKNENKCISISPTPTACNVGEFVGGSCCYGAGQGKLAYPYVHWEPGACEMSDDEKKCRQEKGDSACYDVTNKTCSEKGKMNSGWCCSDNNQFKQGACIDKNTCVANDGLFDDKYLTCTNIGEWNTGYCNVGKGGKLNLSYPHYELMTEQQCKEMFATKTNSNTTDKETEQKNNCLANKGCYEDGVCTNNESQKDNRCCVNSKLLDMTCAEYKSTDTKFPPISTQECAIVLEDIRACSDGNECYKYGQVSKDGRCCIGQTLSSTVNCSDLVKPVAGGSSLAECRLVMSDYDACADSKGCYKNKQVMSDGRCCVNNIITTNCSELLITPPVSPPIATTVISEPVVTPDPSFLSIGISAIAQKTACWEKEGANACSISSTECYKNYTKLSDNSCCFNSEIVTPCPSPQKIYNNSLNEVLNSDLYGPDPVTLTGDPLGPAILVARKLWTGWWLQRAVKEVAPAWYDPERGGLLPYCNPNIPDDCLYLKQK